MTRYNQAFKDQAVEKMMPPNAQSVAEVRRQTGVSEQTLYNWRNRYRQEGKAVPADSSNPEQWSGETKLAVVIETAALNEAERAEYCRKKGLYPEQIARWRESAITGVGLDVQGKQASAEKRELHQERRKSQQLAKELQRKEKALAEAAALLVLAKKMDAIWGEPGDD